MFARCLVCEDDACPSHAAAAAAAGGGDSSNCSDIPSDDTADEAVVEAVTATEATEATTVCVAGGPAAAGAEGKAVRWCGCARRTAVVAVHAGDTATATAAAEAAAAAQTEAGANNERAEDATAAAGAAAAPLPPDPTLDASVPGGNEDGKLECDAAEKE